MAEKTNIQLERRIVKRFLKNDNKRGWIEISVVDWVGEKTYRMIEKREMFMGDDGGEKTGKAKGFNAAEFALLIGNAREIIDLLRGASPEVQNAPQNASQTPPPAAPAGRSDPF